MTSASSRSSREKYVVMARNHQHIKRQNEIYQSHIKPSQIKTWYPEFPSAGIDEDAIKIDDIHVDTVQNEVEGAIENALAEWHQIQDTRVEEAQSLTTRDAAFVESILSAFSSGRDPEDESSTPLARIEEKSDAIVQLQKLLKDRVFSLVPKSPDLVKERTSSLKLQELAYETSTVTRKKNPGFVKDTDLYERQEGFDRAVESRNFVSPNRSIAIYVEILDSPTAQAQAFVFLGNQTLADLSDAIYCISNHKYAKHGRKSNYFFIGTSFYIDKRHADYIDYTEPIRKWIGETPERRKQYLGKDADWTTPPQDTATQQLQDLEVIIGKEYNYAHFGDCEHRVVFRKLAYEFLSEPEEKYPLRIKNALVTKRNRSKCSICGVFAPKKVCYGDRLSKEDPMFYCAKCFDVAHCKENGDLRYTDFICVPYYHR